AVQVAFPPAEKPATSAWPSSRFSAPGLVPPRYQPALNAFLAIVFDTLLHDGLNLAFLSYPDSSFLLAVKVRQGRKVDAILRDLYREAPATLRKSARLKINQERIGTARIHHLVADDMTVHLAFRDDLVAVGYLTTSGKKHLQTLLQAPLTQENPPGPVVRLQ